MKKVVLGLSGGMDSTTLLGLMLEQGFIVHCCSFTYGSKHNKYENQAVTHILDYYIQKGFIAQLFIHEYNLENVFEDFKSNLLLCGGDIPEGHYEAEEMKKTVVPGRNMIFASIMAGLAESVGAQYVALGVHAGDHHIYPDCRKEFIKAFDNAVYMSSDKTVEVLTPLIDDSKGDLLAKGSKICVPYHLTRTCYKDQEESCGKCGSCVERLEAFESLGLKDSIKYQ